MTYSKIQDSSKKVSSTTTDMQQLLAQAQDYMNKGLWAETEGVCRNIFEIEPKQPIAMLVLGVTRLRQGMLDDAEAIFREGCELYTDSVGFHGNLGRLLLMRGHAGRAIVPLQRAVLIAPENPDQRAALLKVYYGYKFSEYNEEARRAMILCLRDPMQNHMLMTGACLSMLLIDPALSGMVEVFSSPDYETFCKRITPEIMTQALNDELLLWSMRRLMINNVSLERGLTYLRRWFLDHVNNEDRLNEFLPFLSILSRYCHFNEYAFLCVPEEESKIISLRAVAQTPACVALLGAYEPLAHHPGAKLFHSLSLKVDDDFKELIRVQIDEPLEEEQITLSIPSVSDIDDHVSQAVRSQYEENPYPRWKSVGTTSVPEPVRELARGKKILIAGCGTGREAVEASMMYPYAHITAVDLSRRSLGYAIRKARELERDNISFVQGDILQLDKLGTKFDMVISSGVLHHMKDPVAGWKKLIEVLRPNGMIKVALYSTIARDFVRNARDYIQRKRIPATAQGIRDFRSCVMAAEDADYLKVRVAAINDFYSLSSCRDLFFHVQEHTFTLPQIGNIIEDLGLKMTKFSVRQQETIVSFRKMFPNEADSENLSCWHKYEQENPYTFSSMYNIWMCRKNEFDRVDSAWIQQAIRT